jgi:ectoine hydroxylase-related dioxygenase (phytanoyl-CoA dioxygenase family)
VSLAGTGDNPEGTGGSLLAWRAKRWILAETTKYLPALFDLQDYRIPPDAVAAHDDVPLPVQAGDVICFHSLLWHASGPNQSETTRYAEVISFMSASARFVGRGGGSFPLSRRP